ncbi:MAG TPA: hypothetical protein VFQ86_10490 [Arachidicoccus soli]|nr:hypothetical protein [Arachidicoccus soli]
MHLQDFIERTNIGMEQLNILIKVGALSFTGKTKKELLWEGNFLRKATTSITVGKSLFVEKPMSFSLPQLPQTPLEDRLQEMDILRFPLANAFEMVEADLSKYPLAKDIPALKGKEITCLAYLVCTKDTATKKDRRRMHFGTFIDAAGDWMDTVHFPNSAAMFPFKGRGFYEFSGIVTEEFGVFTIAVNTMKKVGIKKLN